MTPESVNDLLMSDDYGSRINAVNQMRNLDPAIAVELLLKAAADDNARVRYAAVSQLSSAGDHHKDAVSSVLRHCLLTDSELDVRAAAADSISALKLVDLFDDLKEVYCQTTDWIVRMSIVAALGELGDPRGFEILQDALQSNIDLIQTAAIGALGELGDRRAVDLICPLAKSDDWQVRYRVVQALTALGGDDAQRTLQDLVNDEVEQVAQSAQAGTAS
ncbi:MAG: HEAT repeat domain-containing protein [Leptolyngbyaceae bacterium]|nr:HEAT repeat domain-containing protein [Leptolyngbyaceae bacterium]